MMVVAAAPVNHGRSHAVNPFVLSHPDDESDLSELQIFFKVVKGKLQVNRKTSKLNSSERFRSRLSPKLSLDQVTKSLFDDVDKALRKQQRVYYYALPDALRARLDQDDAFRGSLESDPETRDLINFSDEEWSKFQTAFNSWQQNKASTLSPQLLAGALLANLDLRPLLKNTPLIFDRAIDVPPDVDETGQMTTHVADPIGNLTEDEYSVVVPVEDGEFPHKDKIAPTLPAILNALAPLKGRLWRSDTIGAYLTEFFANSDYQRDRDAAMDVLPAFSVSEPDNVDENGDRKKVIRIGKIRRIARIDLLRFEDNDPATDLVLRQLLNDASFRTFIRKEYGKSSQERPVHKTVGENLLSFHYVYLDTLTGKKGEPHFSNPRFLAQAAALDKLGYSLAQMPYDPETDTLPGGGPEASTGEGQCLYLRYLVGKKSDEQREESAPGTGTPSTSPVSSPLAASTPSPTPQKADIKERKNYLGAELVYKPDQGIRFYGIYQRLNLMNTANGDADFLIKIGNRNDHFIVAGDFDGDNLLFHKIHRRLALTVNGASDFEVRRLFFNTKTDERRQFSSLRAELELWTRPKQLTVFVEGGGGTVELFQNDLSISKQRLNSLSFGANAAFKTDEVVPLRSLQLEPTIRLGLGLAANEPSFRIFSLRGVYQNYRDVPARVGIVIAGRFDLASKDTPIFEQPSFGGVESVRGFREDDAIGRRLWSLQNEIRGPLPGLAPDAQGWRKFVRNQVKLAGFLDIGAVYETTGSEPGFRAGPGVGIRLNFQGVNMKFDLAYGLGDAATGRGRGRFHFSIDTPLRF